MNNDDVDNDVLRVRPPWLSATTTVKEPTVCSPDAFEQAREQDRTRRASVWPLLPPQDCLISHLQLKTILHEIARRNGLTEIDKDIYNVLQYSLFHRVRRVLEELATAARHRRHNAAEQEEEPGISRFPTSNPDAVIATWCRDVSRRQVEHTRRLEALAAEEARRKEEEEDEEEEEEEDDEEEEDFSSFCKRKPQTRKGKKKKARISSRERDDPVAEHARANIAAARMLFDVGTFAQQKQQQQQKQLPEQQSATLPPALTSQQIAHSLASIDAHTKAISDRVQAISWDYKSARQLRLLTESQLSRPLNDADRKTLQELNWKREAHEKLSNKLRELHAQRETLAPRSSLFPSCSPIVSSSTSITPQLQQATRQEQRHAMLFAKTEMSPSSSVAATEGGAGGKGDSRQKTLANVSKTRPGDAITMADALACKSLIGETVFERYEIRRCQSIQQKHETERQENTLLPPLSLRKQRYK